MIIWKLTSLLAFNSSDIAKINSTAIGIKIRGKGFFKSIPERII